MKEHDLVTLRVTLPNHEPPLYAGDHGTIIHVHKGGKAFEVEIDDVISNGKVVISLESDQLYKWHLTLSELMIKELDLTLSDFDHWATDLLVLHTPETRKWLEKNYRWYKNVKGFVSNVEGQDWYGKSALEIPFAYEELRDDLNPYMLFEIRELGWSFTEPEKVGDSRSFEKDNTHVWYCIHGNKGPMWARADLIDDHYRNHLWYYKLMDAIKNINGIK